MSSRDKKLIVAGGLTGAAVIAWRTLFPWLQDDIKLIRAVIPGGRETLSDFENGRYIIDKFEEKANTQPNQTFIIFEDKVYTYGFVNSMANRVANVAATWNLKLGDTCLQKLGLVASFINYHLRDEPLSHSITASDGKALIVGQDDEFLEAVEEIRHTIEDIPTFVLGKQQSELPTGYKSMDSLMEQALPVDLCKPVRNGMNLLSTMCYIFTSGTTGLPKPAIVSQSKAIAAGKFMRTIDLNKNDVVYTTLPLYHSAATLIGLFGVIDAGAIMVLRRKFSTHHFFEDCRKHGVTVIQYIGEMCRYLLRLPPDPLDGTHKIRAAFGNGLRPDIWKEFQTRFKIPHIGEFFAATEGIGSLLNIFDKPGVIGRLSPVLRRILRSAIPIEIVRYDPINDKPIRDKNGRCVKSKRGEEGLIIGLIPPTKKDFYRGTKEMNEKKIIRNAFIEGDAYFSFGDLVYIDNQYYVYFRDRVGDTFRWKGENVSTMEVAHTLTEIDFIQDANVYGVKIPGSDGRAGMAAILLKDHKEVTSEMLKTIYERCKHSLPSYARPLFLRFMKEFTVTQTMKHKKVELREEGFDPQKVTDPLYYLDELQNSYIPLNLNTYQRVLESKL
ncbi:hypothetical protein KUTeg_018312 [Tegillarca granosa]|uniref:Long-chain-fatty-acid--CoA ligase n=1 Tax=Tegillarca granosa TaxID=220873 RepID=A0ABQ9EHF9_TEGGR|nr:hypothetical protein KUTeg_018312 [Tegillarca granosa]